LSGRHASPRSADAAAPDGVERASRPGTPPSSKATAPIFPAEHGSTGPIFPAERSGFSQHKGLFSEFMEPASRADRRTGFTDLL
jgi:hypothetical protein